MKPTLRPPGSKRLKPESHELPSNFAFKFNLRRYSKAVSRQQFTLTVVKDKIRMKALRAGAYTRPPFNLSEFCGIGGTC
jgi:hypothetical protein